MTAPAASGVAIRSLISATLAPVALIGGWTIAAAQQPPGFDSSVDTISALAGYGATDRWIMTVALLCLGLCHLVTASGLWAARRRGRQWLAIGGAGTIAVALVPLPTVGVSVAHAIAAGIAFGALSLWPLFSWATDAGPMSRPAWPLRRMVATVASLTLFVLLGVFLILQAMNIFVGGSERIVAAAQALWPLTVAWGVHLAHSNPAARASSP